jgi:hypothetical protein
MNFIINIFRTFFQKQGPLPLGRWAIDYCNKKTNKKIDLSNEDHCGPCGQYIINKTANKILKDKHHVITPTMKKD